MKSFRFLSSRCHRFVNDMLGCWQKKMKRSIAVSQEFRHHPEMPPWHLSSVCLKKPSHFFCLFGKDRECDRSPSRLSKKDPTVQITAEFCRKNIKSLRVL